MSRYKRASRRLARFRRRAFMRQAKLLGKKFDELTDAEAGLAIRNETILQFKKGLANLEVAAKCTAVAFGLLAKVARAIAVRRGALRILIEEASDESAS